MAHFKTGYFTGGTAAAVKALNIGFTPDYFKIWNISDGDFIEWIRGASATHLGMLSEAASVFQKLSVAATGGIIAIGASAGATYKGIRFGINAKINIAAKLYRWIAWQEG